MYRTETRHTSEPRSPQADPLQNMTKILDDLGSDDPSVLDRAIEEMLRLKAHAAVQPPPCLSVLYSRRQTLPDEERKEFAARVALQFAKLLKSDEDDADITIDDLDDSLKDFRI